MWVYVSFHWSLNHHSLFPWFIIWFPVCTARKVLQTSHVGGDTCTRSHWVHTKGKCLLTSVSRGDVLFLYNWPIHSSTSHILLDFNKFAFLKREDSHLKRMQSILPSHKFQFSRVEWLCKLSVIKKKNTKNYFSERQPWGLCEMTHLTLIFMPRC